MESEEKIKVLVVEDESSIRNCLLAFFEDFGLDVQSVENAESGLKLFSEQKFNAVVVDLRLPGMSGEEFIRNILKQSQHVGIIVHTGSLEVMLSDELRQHRCVSDTIFEKPVQKLEDLYNEVIRMARLCKNE